MKSNETYVLLVTLLYAIRRVGDLRFEIVGDVRSNLTIRGAEASLGHRPILGTRFRCAEEGGATKDRSTPP